MLGVQTAGCQAFEEQDVGSTTSRRLGARAAGFRLTSSRILGERVAGFWEYMQ